MELFLTDIHINRIFHNQNISIPINQTEKKHLIVTGKNGCGKTTLLQAMANLLHVIKDHYRNARSYFDYQTWKDKFQDNYFTEIDINFNNTKEIVEACITGDFIFAVYETTRRCQMDVPNTPRKPNLDLNYNVKERKVDEFLYFLVDLKVQEALARNENQINEANEIKEWFRNFTQILRQIFNDEELELKFNFKNYHFTITLSDGREFGFNELSDGYSAILDIVADLIIKMQNPDSINRVYQKQGIVLIDEIETHLHLELQRHILPILTTIFPNIQFIVTTHSPFILNSLPDAVAFDLERKELLEDLTEYSYESLVNGYFGVSSTSSYLQIKLDDFRKLTEKTNLDAEEQSRLKALDKELDELADAVAPQIKGEYYQIKLQQNKKR